MAYGYHGRILKVNLENLSYEIETKDEQFFRNFYGGSALASYYLLTEMEKGIDPLGPENLLVFSVSVLTGAPVPGTSRFTVAAKSPLTGGFGEAEAGGFWAVELKKAGYEAIVIKGKALKPVWIWIDDNGLEFKDASEIWGTDTGYTENYIRNTLGDEKIRVACIGQGGENLVRYAAVVNELKHANGRSGMGAVMGSKLLKAIAVRGTKTLEFYDKEKLQELTKFFVSNLKTHPIESLLHEGGTIGWDVEDLDACGILPTGNYRGGSFEGMEKITLTAMKEKIHAGRGGCWACPVRCKHVCAGGKFDIDPKYGGPEYETVAAFGSNMLVGDIEVCSKAHELCNKYTLDTISTGNTITFAMDCYMHGLLTKEDTGGVDLVFGNGEAALQLIEDIAFRRGLGNLLAEGSARAAKIIGNGAEKFTRAVKGQEVPMHDPRGKYGLSLAYSTTPSGADHVRCPHDLLFEPGKFGVPELFPLGISEGLPGQNLGPEKVRFFYYGSQTWNLFNTLSLCAFTYGPGKVFTMNHVTDVVNAVTGWDISLFALMKAGERTVTLGKLFNVREGIGRDADTLPDVFFEPFESGILKGKSMDRTVFKKAMELYYEMMGWDLETGAPREARLYELNIHDLSKF